MRVLAATAVILIPVLSCSTVAAEKHCLTWYQVFKSSSQPCDAFARSIRPGALNGNPVGCIKAAIPSEYFKTHLVKVWELDPPTIDVSGAEFCQDTICGRVGEHLVIGIEGGLHGNEYMLVGKMSLLKNGREITQGAALLNKDGTIDVFLDELNLGGLDTKDMQSLQPCELGAR